MSKLSSVFSNKRKKNSTAKSTLMSRMATRKVNKKIEEKDMLLGDLFITIDSNGAIADLNSNYNVEVCRLKVGTSALKKYKTGSIEFNGKDSNLNVKDTEGVSIGIEDFSLDWWECPKPLPVPNINFMPGLQFVMYRNAIGRKQPLLIQNDGENKYISLSSDGDHWDISDRKYMGDAIKDEWAHWALIRCNDNFYTFRNGIVKNIWKSDKAINHSEQYLTVGSGPRGGYFYGHMNKIRFTKGQALWIEEFDINDDLFY